MGIESKPELVFNPETGFFDICFQGCVTHTDIDIYGERERIRVSAKRQIWATKDLYSIRRHQR